MKLVPHEQGTPAWLEWRKTGVGASEAAALYGESPYSTRRELWLAKKGLLPDWFIENDNDYIFNKGHEFEEQMRAEYFAMTGEEFKPLCVVHDTYEFIIASLDGVFGNKIFEAKLVSKEIKDDIAKRGVEAIPRHHWIQMQQQLMVTEAMLCVYFAHDLNGEAVVVEVFPDYEFHVSHEAKLIEFDQSIINNEEPPMTKDDFHFSDDHKSFEDLVALKATMDELDGQAEAAKAVYKAKMAEIVAASPHYHVASVVMAVKIKTMEKVGSVKYTDIPEVKAMSPAYLEAFRGQGSKFIQAWFPRKAKV